uniref:Zinc finger, CCHC-type n=1 Tax=Tanacetum cinerariifolium TaxID=118510 RepID=A0A699H8K6_TANCI|nr:zinc finger, CCHC-type [Tanacetum cinerariifolium]
MGGSYYSFPCSILSTEKDCKTLQRYPDVPTTSQRISIRSMDSFQGLTTKVPHHGIDRWLQIQIFYDHVSFHLKYGIDRVAGGKIHKKNPDESWEIIENLALYDHEGWNDAREFVKPSPFTFRERTGLIPRPQALRTTFEARVRDYMAAHTKRMERFENAIFKQREEISDRMVEMFGLLKELTTSRALEKVLIREETKSPVTKNVNFIFLSRGEEERNDDHDIVTGDDIIKTTGTEMEVSVKEVETKNGDENKTKNKPIKKAEKEQVVEVLISQPVEYCLKHMINEKLIERHVENHRFNDSLSGTRVGKIKGRTYNLLPMGSVYKAILRKNITMREDIGGNFEIPYFVSLYIKENEKRPFILGTPFLTTAKAVIKFDKGTITLRSGKSKISFHMIPESLCKDEKGIKNDIQPIVPTMNVNRLVLEWEEKIKLHEEKEIEFDRWRNKNFKNKRPALVKLKDGIDDEGEVTESLIKTKKNFSQTLETTSGLTPDGVVSPVASRGWSFASAVPCPMIHLVTSLTPDNANSCAMQVVVVAIVGVVVIVVGSSVSSINKLSLVIVACASRAAAMLSATSCRMAA